jgi:hypothetical protein
LKEALKATSVSLDKPETTLVLLRANAVVGVTGFFDKEDRLQSIGIQCAFCHSTVDDSFANGIGRRLDGWPNRDLDVGRIVALAPHLQPLAEHLQVPESKVKDILLSWGRGKYDSELNLDGKAYRPDGKSAAMVLPAARGVQLVEHDVTRAIRRAGRRDISEWPRAVCLERAGASTAGSETADS